MNSPQEDWNCIKLFYIEIFIVVRCNVICFQNDKSTEDAFYKLISLIYKSLDKTIPTIEYSLTSRKSLTLSRI